MPHDPLDRGLRLSLRIPPSATRELRYLCSTLGTTLTDAVTLAIHAYAMTVRTQERTAACLRKASTVQD